MDGEASKASALAPPRRSATMPARPSAANKQTANPESQIETLYDHPSVRIVSFTASLSALTSWDAKSPSQKEAEEEAGKLPCSSRLERTIAVGPFRIYRAPGSVAFLNCRDALQPILPKSQCWSVSEDSSQFVLQIRRPQFWRIELPKSSSEDRQRLETLKDVLDQILLFEKTICPFQRTFTVELPEPPATPVKMVPWKPKHIPVSLRPEGQVDDKYEARLPSQRTASQPVPLTSKIELVRTSQIRTPSVENDNDVILLSSQKVPEKTFKDLIQQFDVTAKSGVASESTPLHNGDQEDEDSRQDNQLVRPILELSLHDDSTVSDTQNQTKEPIMEPQHESLQAVLLPTISIDDKEVDENTGSPEPQRSIIAPPQLTLDTSALVKSPRDRSPLRRTVSMESTTSDHSQGGLSHSSSVGSFHSVESWHEPASIRSQAPSSQAKERSFKMPGSFLDDEQESSPEAKAWATFEGSVTSEDAPRTPTLTDDHDTEDERFEILTPQSTQSALRNRSKARAVARRREVSPMPPAANIFSPSRSNPRRMQTSRHIPTLILQKTCEILLSPPSHLLNLMLSVAAKIAAGEWRGLVFGVGETGETIPVHWDYSEADYTCDWNEDQSTPTRSTPSNRLSGNWEID